MSSKIYVKDRQRTKEEWIEYLSDAKIFPIWNEKIMVTSFLDVLKKNMVGNVNLIKNQREE